MGDLASAHAPKGDCSRDGCQRKAVVKGLCRQHYNQDYNREHAARLRPNRELPAQRVREAEGCD